MVYTMYVSIPCIGIIKITLKSLKFNIVKKINILIKNRIWFLEEGKSNNGSNYKTLPYRERDGNLGRRLP